jgi:hypothetical protein
MINLSPVVTSGDYLDLTNLPYVDVRSFGAVGDGVTNDTAAIQAAVTAAAGKKLTFGLGSYLMGAVTISADIIIEGNGATLLRPSGFDPNNVNELTAGIAHFDITHANARVDISGFTFDGRESLQTAGNPSGVSIRYADVSGATTGTGHIRIHGNKFINQTRYAVQLSGLTEANERQYVSIYENEFLDGRYGIGQGDPASPNANGFSPFSIQVTDHIEARIFDNTFAFRKSITTGQYAPGGVRLTFLGATINADGSSATVSGNTFYRMGRADVDYTGLIPSGSNNGLGAIDFYARGREVVISGNRFDDCINSGIRGKCSVVGVSVTGNVLANTPLAINIGPATEDSQVGNISVTGNVVTGTDQFGIGIVANNTRTNPTVDNISITGNVIQTVANPSAATGNIAGILVRYAKNVTISGNAVMGTTGGGHGIQARNCADVVVSGNTIRDTSGRGVFVESPVNSFDVSGNTVVNSTLSAFVTSGTTTSTIGAFVSNVCDGSVDYGILNLAAVGPISIVGNVLKGITGLGRGVFLNASSTMATVSGNITDAATPTFYSGARHNIREVGNSWNRATSTGTAAPSSGTWAVGDVVWSTNPAAGGTIGWVCTTAGTPGTWKTFGSIEA